MQLFGALPCLLDTIQGNYLHFLFFFYFADTRPTEQFYSLGNNIKLNQCIISLSLKTCLLLGFIMCLYHYPTIDYTDTECNWMPIDVFELYVWTQHWVLNHVSTGMQKQGSNMGLNKAYGSLIRLQYITTRNDHIAHLATISCNSKLTIVHCYPGRKAGAM